VLLLPFDVGVRRLALSRRDLARARDWVGERLPRRRPRPVAEPPSPVARLFQAKSRAEQRRTDAGGAAPGVSSTPSAEDVGPVAQPARPAAGLPGAPSIAPREEPEEGVAGEGETLAGRLLKKRRERGED
jgi:hypothetical protein